MAQRSSPARERLLDAANRLFYRQGYHPTGINQLIEEADVAKASFYNHFSSKEELALAYIQRRHERWMRALKERVDQKALLQRRIVTVFNCLEEFIRQEDFRGCGQLNLAAEFPSEEHPIRVQIRKQKRELRAYLQSIIQGPSEPSEEASKEAKQLANSAYLLYEAAMVESQNLGASWPAEAARQAAEQLIAGRANNKDGEGVMG